MAEISVKRFKNYDGNDIFTQDYDPSKRAYITGTPIDTDGHVCNQVFDKKIYLDETAGQLTAETFKGNLKGNADTATKATQDGNGNVITDTYIKGLSVSGTTITYTKGDNTTGTITTQDTNTTYTSLKNPNAITIKGNGTTSFTYDGSAAKTLNIKAGTNVS